ncbi:MAG TPA: class I SAM-dependent methyltransferase [Burkholderiales bacterium]|nr:class I SAM-dependent methyltransferase [Burkholderiales bacterium]
MAGPSPIPFFEALNGHQKTEAMRAALSLDLFSAVAETQGSLPGIALRCAASERGIRILCDFLVINGFLTKMDGRYALSPDTAPFLVKSSPAYLGNSLEFLQSPELVEGFRDLAGCVRRGGTTVSARGTMETQHPVWVKFARVMGPVIARSAPFIAELVDPKADRPLEVLDIAAGHGLFGIAFAQRNPRVRVTAQDWAPVLEVAREHARQAGVADRHRLLPGDAFEVDLGTGYDVVLLTNFLHHFDVPTCERLLGRVARSLKPGGTAVTLEFVPNEDRVTPPATATFALMMLATTAAGDAYTFSEYQSMLRNAGFSRNDLHPVPESPQSVIVSVM